ncbi:hypothetical protein ER45_030495 (plasmid) [Bacillus mycoides]|nr:hypothetical protein ER45_030495 [Bacillus mycoides]
MARKKITIVTIEVAGEMVEAKECTKCGEVKALNDYYREKNGIGHRRSSCKECSLKRDAEYYQSNKERIAERDAEYYQKNKEKVSERKSKYYQSNKEKMSKQKAEHYQQNKEKISKQKLEYYHNNKESIAKRMVEYRKNNKEVFQALGQRRRARKALLPDTLTAGQTAQLLQKGCALTGETNEVHLDHFIPIAWGYGGTTFENMIPLNSFLNISKSDRNPFEWIKRKSIQEQVDMNRWDETIEYLADLNGMNPQEFEEYVYWCEENKRDLTNIEDVSA